MAWTYAALCPWRGCGFSCSSAAMSWQSVQRDAALDWRAASRLVTKVSNRRDNELIKPKSVGRRRDSQSAIWISFTQPKTLFYFYVGTLGWTRWWKTIPPAPSLLTPTPARSLSTRERGNCGMSRLSLSLLSFLFLHWHSRHRHDIFWKTSPKKERGTKVKNEENSRRPGFRLSAYYGRGVRNIYGLFTLEASRSSRSPELENFGYRLRKKLRK